MRYTTAIKALLLTACVALAATPVSVLGQSQSSEKKAKKAGAQRTLDAITIEGEIAVPQVLFITSRDYRRYRDGLGASLRPGSLDVARAVDLPVRLRFVAKNKEEGE